MKTNSNPYLNDARTASAPIEHGNTRGIGHTVRIDWSRLVSACRVFGQPAVSKFLDGEGISLGGEISARKRGKLDGRSSGINVAATAKVPFGIGQEAAKVGFENTHLRNKALRS
jgi:hypothetical protein